MAEGRGGTQTQNGSGDQLKDEFQRLLRGAAGKVLGGAGDRVESMTGKLTDYAEKPATKALGKAGEQAKEGKSPIKAALSAGAEGIKSKVSDAFGGGKGGKGGKRLKVTNIIEEIDIGAPVSVVYNQWTQFQEFSGFMKKVEDVDQEEDADEKVELQWKAQVLWSHRTWKATILEQVPDRRIVWRSSGEKGHVDGAVTFHELGPELTRVLVVLEYHPQGLFERTGNLWRAQGRRVRLELKHFRRHVMTETMLHADELEGWRGEIHDSKITKRHEEAQGEQDEEDYDEDEEEPDEGEDEAEDEYDDEDELEDQADESDEDEADEDELEDQADESDEDEYEDEDELEDEADEADEGELEDEADEADEAEPDEAEEDVAEEPPPRKRASRSRRPARKVA